MVFAATAATIVAGVVAERTQINAYLAYSFLVSAIIYPIYGHWMWGGGWLSTLPFGAGAKDFAGSGVVHTVGGLVGLAGAAMVEPRIGKFNPDGSPNPIPGHNMMYMVAGTFILIDDVVGAVGVHAGAGLWGLLAVGIFADGTYGGVAGLITGQIGQLIAQIIDMIVVSVWALVTGFLLFWMLRATMGLRASHEEELQGLDVPEHGTDAYPVAAR